MTPDHNAPPAPPRPFNLHNLDYRAEAVRLGKPAVPIIDAHAHINGANAARIYADARATYHVTHTFSQTQLRQADAVKHALGSSVSFVAVPDYMDDDRGRAHTSGFIDAITSWHRDHDARIVKFWCGPRGRLYAKDAGADPRLFTLGHPERRKQMDHAASLGYMFMAHLADPDTWFNSKYTDPDFYGTKASQYDDIHTLADEYPVPWLIAHMGGYPEDLDFLDQLLAAHDNIWLDTSATKWMVRELSKHPTDKLTAFLTKFSGRILFGSDIVTDDAHLSTEEGWRGIGNQAASDHDAWQLYASRYYALRSLFESDHNAPSPIADPDLHMTEPDRFTELDSPTLKGHNLPQNLLTTLYNLATTNTLLRWIEDHT